MLERQREAAARDLFEHRERGGRSLGGHVWRTARLLLRLRLDASLEVAPHHRPRVRLRRIVHIAAHLVRLGTWPRAEQPARALEKRLVGVDAAAFGHALEHLLRARLRVRQVIEESLMVADELARCLHSSVIRVGGRYAARLNLEAERLVHLGSFFEHDYERMPKWLVLGDARLGRASGAVTPQAVAVDDEA